MHSISLAVVAALEDEIRVVRSKMEMDERVHVRPSLFEVGAFGRRKMLLVRTGVGKTAMAKAMAYCIDRFHPQFCLHVGYCGGADPKYQPGDLIVARECIDAASGKRIRMDEAGVEKALAIILGRKMRGKAANLVTTDGVVADPHEKAFVGTEHEADAIDMESAVFAGVCRERGMAHLVVRAVLDPLDCELPDLADSIEESGRADRVKLAGHLIENPKQILGLPRLAYFAAQARGAIAEFVEAWIEKEGT